MSDANYANDASNNPHLPGDYDPYELTDEQYDALRYGQPAADPRYQPPAYPAMPPQPTPRPADPIVPGAPAIVPPQNWVAPTPASAQPPGPAAAPVAPVADAFSNFDPNAYLQQRQQGASGFVDPDQPVPLQGFDVQAPPPQRTESMARLARQRSLGRRDGRNALHEGEPLVRIGSIFFFLTIGILLSLCWISNAVLFIWYVRR